MKLKNKLLLWSISILAIGVLSIIGIKYAFYSPTKINSIIAAKLYSSPANIVFSDQNFYNCVIDSYNKTNNTSLPYTTNLTDEQLLTINSLICRSKSITNTKGIEKLSNLTYLDLSYNDITEINLSNNIALTDLYMTDNNIDEINLSKNTSLTKLKLPWNELTELNITKNIALTELIISYNDITEINLYQNTALEYLDVGSNLLTDIDVSKNTKLTELDVFGNQLTDIDLSKNTALEELFVDGNQLTEIYLSQNTQLMCLSASYNRLTKIDLSKNPELTYVDVRYNELTELDVSRNTELIELDVSYNNIDKLDLSKNTELEFLSISTNNEIILYDKWYTTLDINAINDIPLIKYGNNKVINPIDDFQLYIYDSLIVNGEASVEDTISNLRLQNLTAKVFDNGEEVTEGLVSEGNILTIYDGTEIVQELTIKILANQNFEDYNLYRCVIDAYNEKNSTELSYTTNLTDEQLKSINELSCDYEVLSDKGLEKLTGLTSLTLADYIPEEIDFSLNTNLIELSFYAHNLTQIYGLSELTKLEQLYLVANLYKQNQNLLDFNKNVNLKVLILEIYSEYEYLISIENNINLEYLYTLSLYAPKISDISKLTNLKGLEIRSYETLSDSSFNIDISKNINLNRLYLSIPELESISLENNKNLVELGLEGINLTQIDGLSDLPNLEYFNIYSESPDFNKVNLNNSSKLSHLDIETPNLKELTLNNNTLLSDLTVSTEGLENLNLSTNINLEDLDLEDTKFISTEQIYGYKGEFVNLPENNNVLTLTNNKKSTLKSATTEEINVTVKDTEIKSDVVGTYNVTGVYQHDIQISYNTYEVQYTFNIIEATSKKYIINEEESYIYIGSDTEDEISKNISLNHGTLEIENNEVLIKSDDEVLKEFVILSINFGELNEANGFITLNESIPYNTFTSNIATSDGITYKIFDNDTEVTDGNISIGMILKVFYNDKELETYNITDEYLEFDDSINLNNNDKHLSNISLNTTVNELLEKIYTSGDITIYNKNNVEITDNDLVSTGSKVFIKLTNQTYEYLLVLAGDVDGDGILKLPDIMKMANYTYINKNSLTGVYLEAADFDKNKLYNLQDIMKAANELYIVKGGN